MYIGPGSQETWRWKVPRWLKRNMGWTAKTSCGCVSCPKASNPEGMHLFPKRSSEARWWKHAFRRQWPIYKDDDASRQFRHRHQYSWPNFWLSWKDRQGRYWKSTKYGFSCSYSKSFGDASLSRAPVADNLSNCAWIAEENLSARASTVESDWLANSARAAEGSFQRNNRSGCRKSEKVTMDQGLVRL